MYAAGVLSAIHVNTPIDGSGLTASQWATPCNLRFRDMLTRDTMVPNALGCLMLDAGNLGRFCGEKGSRSSEDLWTIAREINAQVVEQSPEIPSIALWGEKMHVGALPPPVFEALLK